MTFAVHPGGTITEYDWFTDNGFLPLGSQLLVIGAGGVCIQGGQTDKGVTIAAKMRTGISTLESPYRKIPSAIFLHGEPPGDISVAVKVDDSNEYPCQVVTSASDRVGHAKVGRGAHFNAVQVEFSGSGSFHIEAVIFEFENKSRRTGRR